MQSGTQSGMQSGMQSEMQSGMHSGMHSGTQSEALMRASSGRAPDEGAHQHAIRGSHACEQRTRAHRARGERRRVQRAQPLDLSMQMVRVGLSIRIDCTQLLTESARMMREAISMHSEFRPRSCSLNRLACCRFARPSASRRSRVSFASSARSCCSTSICMRCSTVVASWCLRNT